MLLLAVGCKDKKGSGDSSSGGNSNQDVGQLIQTLKTGETQAQIQAADALAELGPKAAEAIPTLIEWANNRKSFMDIVAARSERALSKIGEQAIPPLVTKIKEGKSWPFGVLADMGQQAAPILADFLKNTDDRIRKNAAEALAKGGKAAVPHLVTALNDREENVRAEAAKALSKIGADAESAMPALINALKDKKADVVYYAVIALKRIGPPAKAAIPLLQEIAKDDRFSNTVHEEAKKAIAAIGG